MLVLLRIALLASTAVLTGAISAGFDSRLYEAMSKCSFPGSFVEDGQDNVLDFTIKLPINVPTVEDAQGAFKAVQADINSPLFWPRWDEDEIEFKTDGSSVVIVDPGVTHYIEDFSYDSVNHCDKFSFSVEADEFPEGVKLRGDCIDVLIADPSSTNYFDFFGFFNCRFDGDTPGLNQTEYCHSVAEAFSHSDPDVAVCLMQHWNDGQHEQCRQDGDSRMWH